MDNTARPIAIYLPQYHPIPENDEWWGKGFTEWTNVARARPLFNGHYQPHLPADLGFYDLRLPEVRQAQADMARQYGIHGFCYYHYWFNGRRLLERPFNDVLSSGKPDFPFCLCWANETWSRRWLGEEKQVLLRQTYSQTDDVNHARKLLEAFADHRYIKIYGRPVFIIYRPTDLPDPQKTTDTFRDVCVKAGLSEPYLVGVNSHRLDIDYRKLGFDDVLDFLPSLGVLGDILNNNKNWQKFNSNLKFGILDRLLKVYDYKEAYRLMNARKLEYSYLPSVFVSWDNSARRNRNGIIITNTSLDIFREQVERAVHKASQRPIEERFFFINAWNEWAEGNHLEPCQKWGHSFLEIIKSSLNRDESIAKSNEISNIINQS